MTLEERIKKTIPHARPYDRDKIVVVQLTHINQQELKFLMELASPGELDLSCHGLVVRDEYSGYYSDHWISIGWRK